MNTDKKDLCKCWSCERLVKKDELTKVCRPMLANETVEEMECLECSKLTDSEWAVKMNEKWRKKISDEYERDLGL